MRQETAYEKSSGFLDDLNRAAKDNPIAAGLIGAGIAWMFLGNRPLRSLRRQIPRAARGAYNTAASGAGAVGSMVAQGASSASAAASDVASRAGEGVQRMAEQFKSTEHAVGSARDSYYEEASEAGTDYRQQARELAGDGYRNFSAAIERQPLLLGALGLAAGIGMALAFPPTEAEKEILGEAGDSLKEKTADLFETAKQRTSAAMAAMAEEAQKQNLTASAMKEELSAQAKAAKNVAAESLRRR